MSLTFNGNVTVHYKSLMEEDVFLNLPCCLEDIRRWVYSPLPRTTWLVLSANPGKTVYNVKTLSDLTH